MAKLVVLGTNWQRLRWRGNGYRVTAPWPIRLRRYSSSEVQNQLPFPLLEFTFHNIWLNGIVKFPLSKDIICALRWLICPGNERGFGFHPQNLMTLEQSPCYGPGMTSCWKEFETLCKQALSRVLIELWKETGEVRQSFSMTMSRSPCWTKQAIFEISHLCG